MKQESYKQINSIELKSAKSKKSINFYKFDQDHASQAFDYLTAGTDGESDPEDFGEGFFTADQGPKRNSPIKGELMNIDIGPTSFNVGSYINQTAGTDGGNDKSMFNDMQHVINVVTQNLKNEIRNQQIETI